MKSRKNEEVFLLYENQTKYALHISPKWQEDSFKNVINLFTSPQYKPCLGLSLLI